MNFSPMIRQQIKDFAFEASYQRVVHSARLPFDATLDDVLTPGFWGMVANQLKPGDHIECFRPDYSLYVVVVVTHTERGMAKVILISGRVDQEKEKEVASLRASKLDGDELVEAPEETPAELAEYKIGFNPSGFYVQFKPSRETIASKLPTKAAAVSFALAHKAKAAGVAA